MRPRTTQIGFKGAQTLYYAKRQAQNIGLPLNTLVTINFSHTTIEPWEAVKAFGRWRISHFNKWAKRPQKGCGNPFEPTYAYWFENKRDNEIYDAVGKGLPHNVHVQFYVHIPPIRSFNFQGRAYEWLDFIAGDFCAKEAVKIERVKKDNGVIRYGTKGASKAVAGRFGAGEIQCPQGMIIGRRTGTSLNIGPSARRAMDKKLGIVRRVPSLRPLVGV